MLVGESGAGPHDLVRMMRQGRVYWASPESQFYAEPKRLAAAGYLEATKQPGRTHERTHYTLTRRRAGRAEGVAGHARPASRASRTRRSSACSAAEYADRGELLKSLNALREDLDVLDAELASAERRESDCRTARRHFGSTGGLRSGSSTLTAHGWTRSKPSSEGPFAAISEQRGFGRLPHRRGLPFLEEVRSDNAWDSSRTSPASVAVTWRSIWAPPTRSSTCVVAASSSANLRWSRSTAAPARSMPSGSRPSACSAARRARSAPSGR